MSTYLVTGCAGFIGSHLTEKLLASGHTVYGVDNFDPFYPRNIKERNISAIRNHPQFQFFEISLSDYQMVRRVPLDEVDVVIHLAGKAGVRPSIQDPNGYIDANIVATQNILNRMRDAGKKKLVFASSSSVYGNMPETPYREDMDVSNPISPYAFTKKACELINYTFHHLYGMDILNLRFFTVYGPRQRPDLAIHKFIHLMKSGRPIPVFGDGSTSRDYTFVADTVDGIVRAIGYVETNSGVYDIINLGNNTPISLNDLIGTIAKVSGITPVIDRKPMQPGDVNITFADISRAQNLLGYQPKTKLEDGIRSFMTWFDQQYPSV
ncbi:MAG: GDP-mannose 4,6-dehydratase [Bacteroidetes bacterium]|nr:GDP-mannose 4,6-dehydratase [Bacteroidota bacterium]